MRPFGFTLWISRNLWIQLKLFNDPYRNAVSLPYDQKVLVEYDRQSQVEFRLPTCPQQSDESYSLKRKLIAG